MIAGHAVPKCKIGDEPGLALEIRSPRPTDREPFGYSDPHRRGSWFGPPQGESFGRVDYLMGKSKYVSG
jgi:hypothetical protein